MPVKIYHDADADIDIVRNKTVSFIGYGNQGRAQALNLRDSGITNIIIGNIDDDYARQARDDGFNPISIEEAVRQGDILMLLIPDEDQQTVWNEKIRENIQANSTLVVASGYNVAFNLLSIPDDMDVVMVAPRMIGAGVRDRYVQKIPYPCFVSVEKDVSGRAWSTCLSIACAIGATRGNGAVSSSCREEAGIDLFAEQALWPEIMAIFREGYNVLHDAGFSDEAILFDMYLSKEPAEIFERAADEGFVKQLKYHSRTSQYGQLSTMNRHDGKDIREKFQRILHENILSGKFAEKWSNTTWAATELAKEWKEIEHAPIVQADERVRSVLQPDRKK
jgi:ketol-acid reductoisomerase